MTKKSSPEQVKNLFTQHFKDLKDPRRTKKGNVVYSMNELLFVAIVGAVSGYRAWSTIAEYGRIKQEWFRKYFTYKRMPSHDILGDFFGALDSVKFGECLTSWLTTVIPKSSDKIIAIDGKTIRGAASNCKEFPMHIVTAFDVGSRISIGQQEVEGKSNEITAIPKLLDTLDLENCWVTLDAMGCEKEIASKIIERGGEFVFAVKDNQQFLHDDIKDAFEHVKTVETDTQNGIKSGRSETRICKIIKDPVWVCKKDDWNGLSTLIEITSMRTIKKTGATETSVRHYISSAKGTAKEFNNAIRMHWGIENNLHWSLDVIYREDGQLKRIGNSAQNCNLIFKAALSMIENEKTTKMTKPMKMMKAAHQDDYRELVLKV